MPNKGTSNDEEQRMEIYYIAQTHTTGSGMASTSAHVWGTDMSFRFK
jgi:hypothetical protein